MLVHSSTGSMTLLNEYVDLNLVGDQAVDTREPIPFLRTLGIHPSVLDVGSVTETYRADERWRGCFSLMEER